MVPFASWSVLTTDFLIILYLTLSGVVFSSILQLSGARWHYELRKVALSLYALYPLAFILLVVLLAAGKTTFPWLGSVEHSSGWHTYTLPLGAGSALAISLPEWHNYTFLIARQIGGFLLVAFLYGRYIKLLAVSDQNMSDWKRFRRISYWVPAIFVLYGTLIAWDFEMTLLPEWHSAIYAMYHFVSNFGMFISFTITLVYFLSKNGMMAGRVPEYVYNYISQLLLGFTLIWTYTFFAQYLTIWYGNLPDERNRLTAMEEGDYSVLWWSFIALKFLIPFGLLIFDYVRHSPGMIVAVACSIILGTWIEQYTWISGSYPAGPFQPGYTPMTSAFDIIATLVIALAAYALVRLSLVRNRVVLTSRAPSTL
ncbi:MAG: hypothetical protein WAK07_13905 [Rhodomicrobium sp.]